jgi:hypothetical protein
LVDSEVAEVSNVRRVSYFFLHPFTALRARPPLSEIFLNLLKLKSAEVYFIYIIFILIMVGNSQHTFPYFF